MHVYVCVPLMRCFFWPWDLFTGRYFFTRASIELLRKYHRQFCYIPNAIPQLHYGGILKG